jgi:hypothetical protein
MATKKINIGDWKDRCPKRVTPRSHNYNGQYSSKYCSVFFIDTGENFGEETGTDKAAWLFNEYMEINYCSNGEEVYDDDDEYGNTLEDWE